MLRKIIYRISYGRHPWRALKFDELAEIYMSMVLRSFGFSIIGIFVPVYLYLNGVSLQDLLYFFSIFFLIRLPLIYLIAYQIARIGPKHVIAHSTFQAITFLLFLITFPTQHWPLELLAALYTISNASFFIAYNTDFSKVKSAKHGGKELGWLYIFEKIGGTIGPVVGGLLATFVSEQIAIGSAIVILMLSLIPLFITSEPVRTHQKIVFTGFPYRKHVRDFMSLSAFHIDNFSSMVFWPLFISVAVFTDGTYAKLGIIIAVGMVISIISAQLFGSFIDGRRGLALLRFGTVMNAITHMLRPFTQTFGGVAAITALNEPITLAYRMPLFKGYYDSVDSEEGYRIVYISLVEIVTSIAKAGFCLSLYGLSFFFDSMSVLQYSFIAVSIISIGVLLQRFPSLRNV